MTYPKVVFIIYSLRGGGAERVLTLLANSLSEQFRITIILLSKQEVFFNLDSRIQLIEPDFKKNNPNRFLYLLRQAVFLRKSVKKATPDAVFSFMESINSFVLLSLIGIPAKKYVSNRASPVSSLKGFRGLVNPWIYLLADGVIIQTQKAIQILKKKYRGSKLISIPNPVFIPEKVVPILSREKAIINVGYLGGRKNQEALIRIFSRIQRKNGWRLILVGEGPDRERLEVLAGELNEKESISFLGARKDVPELLNYAQIFAFTSQTEGFPNALAEAMAHGCACISYDCITGPSELVSDGENGLLVELDNEAEYCEKLSLLVHNEDLRKRFSLSSHKSVEKFDFRNIVSIYACTHGLIKSCVQAYE